MDSKKNVLFAFSLALGLVAYFISKSLEIDVEGRLVLAEAV